jgi:preprotein translocase subunit SecD
MLVIIAAVIGYFVYVSSLPGASHPFRLGLDLSGGSHLVFSADVSKVDQSAVSDSMSALRDDVEKRVNTFGVSEPLVQTEQGAALSSKESAYKLIVELPGVTDPDAAAAAIGATPKLDFRLVTAKDMNAYQASSTSFTSTTTQAAAYLALFKTTGLDGGMIAKASLQFNTTTNQPSVGLQFTSDGSKLFDQITKSHIGDYLGIFLDGNPISVPVIRDEIADGRAEISGTFTVVEAQTLVRNINFGALPVPIKLISTQTIGPTLGQAAVNGGIKAGIVAFIIIALFLIFWYRLPGFVAVVALAVYTVLMLALFKLIPVTLTAAGIAGFIITIGMAVDANILIFERMKEELNRGRGVSDAMHEGFARAWTSIRDSNISSIITGAVLYYFGSTSVVTGFALVFVIGVLVSMFTAITASRLLLYAVAPANTSKLSTFLISNGFRKSENRMSKS